MLLVQPKPKPNQPPSQASPFETGETSRKSEMDQLIRALGEQVSGNYSEPLHPVLEDRTIDNLKAKDESHVKANYPTLQERLRHISQTTKEREVQTKLQNERRQTASGEKPATQIEEMGKGKKSLRERMFSALGIKGGRKTASLADKSQTREIARTPSQ
ncbi:MAG: hypothetical protein HYW33_03130 [Candidatus Blackburnbacteria bacterium]|nr:hypothetical protein [Candidatus Blackburnbacteria bacterium]